MSAHPNSLSAFAEVNEDGVTANRRNFIMRFLRSHGPATDREVMQGLGFVEMNCVRPRLTELIEDGRAVEVGGRKCPVTGKMVRVVSAGLV